MSITAELPSVLDGEFEVVEQGEDGCLECGADGCDVEPTEEAGDEGSTAEQISGQSRESAAIAEYESNLERARELVANTALYQAKAEAAAKMAKAEAKLALEQLQKIIDRGPEHYPLFDAETKDEESTETTDESDPDNDESWKAVEIGEIDIPEGILNKLIEAGIETVGDLSNWSESGQKLTDIGGIGLAKADKIEEAMDAFWASRSK